MAFFQASVLFESCLQTTMLYLFIKSTCWLINLSPERDVEAGMKREKGGNRRRQWKGSCHWGIGPRIGDTGMIARTGRRRRGGWQDERVNRCLKRFHSSKSTCASVCAQTHGSLFGRNTLSLFTHTHTSWLHLAQRLSSRTAQ